MKRASVRIVGLAVLCLAAAVFGPRQVAFAQAARGKLVLYVDQRTGQVFVRPGRGRVRWVIPSAAPSELDQQIEQKVDAKTQALQQELSTQQAQSAKLEQANVAMSEQLKAMKPAWKDYLGSWSRKMSIGALVYADYGLYTHTGFGPQFLTQINQPGPGNNIYNSFDITRTYFDFKFRPDPGWLLRLTPNIYRQTTGAPSYSYGAHGTIGSSLNGPLGYRLKYAYLQYDKAFDWSPMLKGGSIAIGMQANPLVAWEEDLYGYRFVNLTPWNYLSLSSTQGGLGVNLPWRFNEKTYAETEFGVYNQASFHDFERADNKQFMGRLTVYPFGEVKRFNGLGLTGFYDYGYGNNTPDTHPDHVTRIAAIVHYATSAWNVAFEYDYGYGAFGSGNLFSGSGPNPADATVAPIATLAKALLNNSATQQGFDFFGHYDIPRTKFALFGMFQWFMPNTQVNLNPFDFQRMVLGVAYKYSKHLEFALDSQNVLYYHKQFTFSDPSFLGYFPAGTTTTSTPFAVQRDIHAIFLNIQFKY